MGSADRRTAQLATLGFACVVVITAASAFLRVHGYDAPVAPPGVIDAVRGAHRVAAILAGLAILALAALSFRRRGANGDRAIALVLLVLTAVLAWVGRSSAGTPPAAVAATNLLGGFVLAGLLWWLRLRQSRPVTASAAGSAALAVVVAQIALGAALALTRADTPILLLGAHIALGLAYTGLCLHLRSPLLIGLAAAQIIPGAAMALGRLPFVLVYCHNLLALLLLVATIDALHRPRAA